MKIKVVNKSKHRLPQYDTGAYAGVDLRANLDNNDLLNPMERSLVPTGIFQEIPIGYEAQMRSRRGPTINDRITILNSTGTIDADYRGEVCIIMVNLSSETFVIRNGELICQIVIAKHGKVE